MDPVDPDPDSDPDPERCLESLHSAVGNDAMNKFVICLQWHYEYYEAENVVILCRQQRMNAPRNWQQVANNAMKAPQNWQWRNERSATLAPAR